MGPKEGWKHKGQDEKESAKVVGEPGKVGTWSQVRLVFQERAGHQGEMLPTSDGRGGLWPTTECSSIAVSSTLDTGVLSTEVATDLLG